MIQHFSLALMSAVWQVNTTPGPGWILGNISRYSHLLLKCGVLKMQLVVTCLCCRWIQTGGLPALECFQRSLRRGSVSSDLTLTCGESTWKWNSHCHCVSIADVTFLDVLAFPAYDPSEWVALEAVFKMFTQPGFASTRLCHLLLTFIVVGEPD